MRLGRGTRYASAKAKEFTKIMERYIAVKAND